MAEPLTQLELTILAAAGRLFNEAFSTRIVRDPQVRERFILSAPEAYRILLRLEKWGLLRSSRIAAGGIAAMSPNKRACRVFWLTGAGREQLTARWKDLIMTTGGT